LLLPGPTWPNHKVPLVVVAVVLVAAWPHLAQP
jgi:cytochrome bd-type quinol oxidase subunit 2